jgi:hypothetical protein
MAWMNIFREAPLPAWVVCLRSAHSFGGEMMKTFALIFAVSVVALNVSPVFAGYASDRTACLAEAGTDEATFSARRATYAQGIAYQQCMAAKGRSVTLKQGVTTITSRIH